MVEGQKIQFNEKKLAHAPLHCVMAVSAEFGIEEFVLSDKPIDSIMHRQIFKEIDCNGKDFIVLCYNYAINRYRVTPKHLLKNSILQAYNVA